MATKKAASPKKAVADKPAAPKKQSTTKVTTVKAVEARPAYKTASTSSRGKLLDRVSNAPFVAALIAEFVGTFLLATAIVVSNGQSAITALFAMAGIAMVIGTLSSGYANPAITIASWVTRRIGGLRALGYIVAQLLGAMLALVMLNAFISAGTTESATSMLSQQPQLFKAAALPAGKEWLVFAAELIGTAIFGFAVAAATRMIRQRAAQGLTVGLGLFTALLIGGSLASMIAATAILNPAIAISLQAFSFASVWPIAIYGLGSILGAIIGFLLYDFLRSAEVKKA